MPLTEEQKAQIERNRLAALERKKKASEQSTSSGVVEPLVASSTQQNPSTTSSTDTAATTSSRMEEIERKRREAQELRRRKQLEKAAGSATDSAPSSTVSSQSTSAGVQPNPLPTTELSIIEQKRLKALEIKERKAAERRQQADNDVQVIREVPARANGGLPATVRPTTKPNTSYFAQPGKLGGYPGGGYSGGGYPGGGYPNKFSALNHSALKPKISPTRSTTPYNRPNGTTSNQQVNGSDKVKTPFEQMKTCNLNIRLASSDRLDLVFSFNQKMIDAVKQVRTASFNQIRKCWTIDLCDYEEVLLKVKELKKSGLEVVLDENYVNGRVVSLLIRERNARNQQQVNLMEGLHKSMIDKLFPFQLEGIQFAIAHEGRCLIADEMGLGKTVQALAVAEWFKQDWPLLIVCPASLTCGWEKAVLEWLPEVEPSDIEVVGVKQGSKYRGKAPVTIMSYDRLRQHADDLAHRKVNFVIFDESHSIKNDETQRSRAAAKVGKVAKRMILLSGTPALSRPIELFPQISLINPQLFPNKHEFGMRYCAAYVQHLGPRQIWNYKGCSNADELKVILESTIMIRRLKKDVITNLPPKTRNVVTLPINFDETDNELMDFYNAKFSTLAKSRKFANDPVLMEWYAETVKIKTPVVLKYLTKLIDQGKKFICFAHHGDMLNAVSNMLAETRVSHMRIDGSTPPKLRQECCEYFQNSDECRVAVISIVAAGVGLTLTAANLVVFTELYWTPGALIQVRVT